MAEISPLRRRMIEDMTVRNLSPARGRLDHDVVELYRHPAVRERLFWLSQYLN